jgi:hypothetical protein
MWKLLLVMLFVTLFIGIKPKPCGIPQKCECYKARGLITCWKQKLEKVPNFSRSEMKIYKILDLR